MACGGLHTLAVTKEGKVYVWGSTEGGQLGLPLPVIQKISRNIDLNNGSQANVVVQPQLLASLQEHQITQVSAGEIHSICLTKTGTIFGWGWSSYGQLGLGFSDASFEHGLAQEQSKAWEPKKIETLNDEQISKIYCGYTFTLFMTTKGELYGCGMNDQGQLGEDVFDDLSALEKAKKGSKEKVMDITIPTQVQSL